MYEQSCPELRIAGCESTASYSVSCPNVPRVMGLSQLQKAGCVSLLCLLCKLQYMDRCLPNLAQRSLQSKSDDSGIQWDRLKAVLKLSLLGASLQATPLLLSCLTNQ
jgi:hypothetical protein